MYKLFLFLIAGTFLVSCSLPGSVQPTAPVSGAVYISRSELLIMESYPVQISLHIVGDLPTPCHTFAAEVAGPNLQNRIDVIAFNISDPQAICIQVLEPFDESVRIPMDGEPEGIYSVWLNGEFVGEFSYPASA